MITLNSSSYYTSITPTLPTSVASCSINGLYLITYTQNASNAVTLLLYKLVAGVYTSYGSYSVPDAGVAAVKIIQLGSGTNFAIVYNGPGSTTTNIQARIIYGSIVSDAFYGMSTPANFITYNYNMDLAAIDANNFCAFYSSTSANGSYNYPTAIIANTSSGLTLGSPITISCCNGITATSTSIECSLVKLFTPFMGSSVTFSV